MVLDYRSARSVESQDPSRREAAGGWLDYRQGEAERRDRKKQRPERPHSAVEGKGPPAKKGR